MRTIKTYENILLNIDCIAMIQPVFIDTRSDRIIEFLDDEFDPDTLEFAIAAILNYGDEVVIAAYETEEERDYAYYKLENWLTSDLTNKYTMTDRK